MLEKVTYYNENDWELFRLNWIMERLLFPNPNLGRKNLKYWFIHHHGYWDRKQIGDSYNFKKI